MYVKTRQEVFCIFPGLLGFWVENATKGILSSSLTRLNHFDFGLFGLKVAALSIFFDFMNVGWSMLELSGRMSRMFQQWLRTSTWKIHLQILQTEQPPQRQGNNLRGVNLSLLSVLEVDSGPRTLDKAPQRMQQIAIASPAKKSTSLQVPESLTKDLAKEHARCSEAQNRLLTYLNWDTDGKWKERLRTLRSYLLESWKIKIASVLKVSRSSCFMRWFQCGGRMSQQRRTSTWKTRLQKKQLLQRQGNNLRAANGCSCALILEFYSCGQWWSYTSCILFLYLKSSLLQTESTGYAST